MDPEHAWQDLVAAALLGTDRRGFTPPAVDGPPGPLLGGLVGRGPERALLGSAAALAAYRRAGRLPEVDPSPPIDPAPEDARPRCSAGSDGHLALMLSGTHAAALPEWLGALASAGRRPAEEAIPELLELARSRLELRPAVAAAIGPLGRWLARQNPDWAFAVGPEGLSAIDDAAIEALWQTGTIPERAALLRRVRGTDPPRARALVASTWGADGPEARAGFLPAFAVGLGRDDEPFLEAALDDRRKEVRAAAAEVLARLPGSDYVGRMAARAAAALGFSDRARHAIRAALRADPPGDDPGPPPAPFAEVIPPEAFEKAMARDGIDPRPGREGLGERAWWLSEMIARVPPSAWSGAWGLPPAELAGAAVRSKWADAIYPGLVEAAVLHRDSDWLDALLPHRRLAGNALPALAVLNALPDDRREATVLGLIRADDGEARIRFAGDPLTEEQIALLDRVPAPWGPELSALVLDRLARNLGDRNHFHHALVGLLGAAARSLPAAGVLARPPRRTVADGEVPAYLLHEVDRHLDAFHALIRFRHDMIQELRA